jgi:hypothetical protein
MNSMHYLASAYGAGSYDTTTYNGSPTGSSTTPSTNTTHTSGSLADTGTAIVVFVTIACLVIFAALVIRLWHKPHRSSTTIAGQEASSVAPKKEL